MFATSATLEPNVEGIAEQKVSMAADGDGRDGRIPAARPPVF